MNNIYKRQPIQHKLPVGWNNLDAVRYNNLNSIKGLQHIDNPVNSDQESTYNCKNVYQDESGNLTVRPSLRIVEHIVNELNAKVLGLYETILGEIIHYELDNKYYLRPSNSSAPGTEIGKGNITVQESDDKVYILHTNIDNCLRFSRWTGSGLVDVNPVILTNKANNPIVSRYNLLTSKYIYETGVIPSGILDLKNDYKQFAQGDDDRSFVTDTALKLVYAIDDSSLIIIYGFGDYVEVMYFKRYDTTWQLYSDKIFTNSALRYCEDLSVNVSSTLDITITGGTLNGYSVGSRVEINITYTGTISYHELSIKEPNNANFQRGVHVQPVGKYTIGLYSIHDGRVYLSIHDEYGEDISSQPKPFSNNIYTDNIKRIQGFQYKDRGIILLQYTSAAELWFFDYDYSVDALHTNVIKIDSSDCQIVPYKDSVAVSDKISNRLYYNIPIKSGLLSKLNTSYSVIDMHLALDIKHTSENAIMIQINDKVYTLFNDSLREYTNFTYSDDRDRQYIAPLSGYDIITVFGKLNWMFYFSNIQSKYVITNNIYLDREVSDNFPVLSEVEDEVLTSFYLDNVYWFVTKHRIFGTGVANEQFTIRYFDPRKYFHFDEELTGAVRISDNSFWVFHNNGAYLIYKSTSELYDETVNEYVEVITWLCTNTAESKGCDFENAVLTLPVSSYIASVTSDDISYIQMRENVQTDERILVPMTLKFRKFVASLLNETESVVTGVYRYNAVFFLNPVHKINKVPALVYNTTTDSWWYWEFPVNRVIQARATETNIELLAEHENKYSIYDFYTEYYDYNLGGLVYHIYADRIENNSPVQIEWFWESAILHFGTVDYRKQLLFTNFTLDERESSEISFDYNFEVYTNKYSDRTWTPVDKVIERARTFSYKTIIANFAYLQLYLKNRDAEENEFDAYTRPKFSTISFKYRLLSGGHL